MEVEDERIELEDAELDGGEDVSKYGTFSKDMNWSNNVVSIQPVDKTVPSPQVLSHQAVTNTIITATVSTTQPTSTPLSDRRQLLRVSPGTALSDKKRTKLLKQLLESPLPVPSFKLSSTQEAASFSLTAVQDPVIPNIQLSPSPSTNRRKLPSVSPGTALSDKKRQAVLQQLLDSPQSVLHNRPAGEESYTVLDVDREKVETIMTPTSPMSGKKNEGSGENMNRYNSGESNFGEEKSSGFSFDRNPGVADHSFHFGGVDDKGFSFGGGAETGGGFSFLGDDEDMGGKNETGVNDFTFSFAGGSFEGEKEDGAGGRFTFF